MDVSMWMCAGEGRGQRLGNEIKRRVSFSRGDINGDLRV